MTAKRTDPKMERVAHLRWIPLNGVKVNPLAQRDLNTARVSRLVAEFDPEQLGAPTVNHRDDYFYVIDGQHRIEALKQWLGDWDKQQVQCWTYESMTEDQEAEVFLKLNDTLSVAAFAKFRVGVQAGRPDECEIERVVRSQGLRISQDKSAGAIGAVGTLIRVYRRSDANTLGRTLRIIRDAYGDAGFEGPVIDGLGLLCHRYNGDLEEPRAVERLSKAYGGVSGLLNKAGQVRQQTGSSRAHCVAAAAVEIINAGRGGKKLASWWRADD